MNVEVLQRTIKKLWFKDIRDAYAYGSFSVGVILNLALDVRITNDYIDRNHEIETSMCAVR